MEFFHLNVWGSGCILSEFAAVCCSLWFTVFQKLKFTHFKTKLIFLIYVNHVFFLNQWPVLTGKKKKTSQVLFHFSQIVIFLVF